MLESFDLTISRTAKHPLNSACYGNKIFKSMIKVVVSVWGAPIVRVEGMNGIECAILKIRSSSSKNLPEAAKGMI